MWIQGVYYKYICCDGLDERVHEVLWLCYDVHIKEVPIYVDCQDCSLLQAKIIILYLMTFQK